MIYHNVEVINSKKEITDINYNLSMLKQMSLIKNKYYM